MAAPVFDSHVRDLAESIYLELLRDAVKVTKNSVTVNADPKSLAQTSFQLAASFQVVQSELNAAKLPKKFPFELDAAHIREWSK